MISNDDIKREFLAAGFTVKPGNDDLKPYVYEAARRVIAMAEAAEREQMRGLIETAREDAAREGCPEAAHWLADLARKLAA